MTWEYRVCKEGAGEDTSYSIREVYYNSLGDVFAISATPDCVVTWDEDMEDKEKGGEQAAVQSIKDTLIRMLEATNKPVIDMDNVVYAPRDRGEDDN